MGNFYANLTVHDATTAATARFLEQQKRPAFVSPRLGNDVVAFVDAYGDDEIAAVAKPLSSGLGCAVLGALNHDDDMLTLALFQAGKRTHYYNSAPHYFVGAGADEAPGPTGAIAQALCEVFEVPDKVARIEEILGTTSSGDEGYVFAIDRHTDLVAALGIPNAAAGGGYEYIRRGEEPPSLARRDLVETCGEEKPRGRYDDFLSRH